MIYKLNAERLADIILCDPVTKKGKRELERLGLSTKDVSVDFFYENLYVSSRYNGEYVAEVEEDEEFDDDYWNEEEFNNIKDSYNEFKIRLTSDMQNQSPLLILGVAGNGKSIEINHILLRDFGKKTSINKVYIDFEDSPSSTLTYVEEFPIPDPENVLWVFCSKIMECIMEYIIHRESECAKIRQVFFEDIWSYRTTDVHKELFKAIGKYRSGNRDTVKNIFILLKNVVDKDGPKKGIQSLLKILLWLMYCSGRDKMNYIVFDNIESYIYLDDRRIQILDDDIKTICSSIRAVTDEVIREFNNGLGGSQKDEDLGWKRFKVVIVARRTSLGVVGKMVLQRPLLRKKNIVDLTGHFQVSAIWENKKKYIWDDMIKDVFIQNDPQSESIINIADFVIRISKHATGKSYQSLIAPLMSYGIRRNAYAQARAIVDMNNQFIKEDGFSITKKQFDLLRGNEDNDYLNLNAKFMVRRALIENQFRWSIISQKSRKRWKQLGIGNLMYDQRGRVIKRFDRISNIKFAPVIYIDGENITLMHRVLSYLSYFPDFSADVSKSIDSMFATVSLYDLIKGVMIAPDEERSLSKVELKPLARVIISLGDMDNDETKGAPFAILGIKDKRFHNNPSEETLAGILQTIYEAGKKESEEDGTYNPIDYGIRLTDAGYCFLRNWMASFAFMESLYCYPIPSLFYLNKFQQIELVIRKVYEAADNLRCVYEKEAWKFCKDKQKFYSGQYFVIQNEEILTYREQIIKDHKKHLDLYRGYISRCYQTLGIDEIDSNRIIDLIDEYIEKYDRWRIDKKWTVCF